ncbi:MAG: HAD-IA family hydrolase [Hyphomicrobiales bacterium]
MQHSLIIFDVDGVLLDLTAAEEDVFFESFAPWCDPASLSRDWNSYRIRNDDNIVDEIMETLGLPRAAKAALVDGYHARLGAALASGRLKSPAIAGAGALLQAIAPKARLGIATANFREAAKLRLQAAGLWQPVAAHAFGADGGGAKRDILARAIAASGLSRERILFIGDNVNDVAAGLGNGVAFIGFSESASRRRQLADAGALQLSANHDETCAQVLEFLKD